MPLDKAASSPSDTQIRDQRDRILASKLFSNSKRQSRFLDYIINETLEGRADKLKEFSIGVEVFSRDSSFDPGSDSIVRGEAIRLRAKLREYYHNKEQEDLVLIDIPKGHYIPEFSLIDSAGVEIEKDIESSETSISFERNNFYYLVIGLIFLISLFLITFYFQQEKPSPTIAQEINDKSIAVLPFLPLSSGEDDGYFADGLTEEILNSLARLPDLQVTARTSSFFFKGQDLLISDIASRLGVAYVVEGSVRRDGERLRIASQLIRASDNFHMWSQIYDRKRDDVFAVQLDIARNIAEVLGVVLDEEMREIMRSTGIHDVEAFIAYQKGQEAWVAAHQGVTKSDDLLVANAHFETALEAAPGLTMARLMKADLRSHIIYEIAAGFRSEKYPGEQQVSLEELLDEYDLAINLSSVGNQRDILATERTLVSEEWTGLAFQLQKAMQAGDCPQMNWSTLAAPFGWADQLVRKYKESIRCNPMDKFASFQLAWSLIWAGQPDAALQAIAEAENKGLSHPSLNDGRHWAMLASGRVDNQSAFGTGPKTSRLSYRRRILREALAGDPAVAQQMANDYWLSSETDDVSSIVIAAAVGDRKKANEAVARIDASPGSAVVISHAVFNCFCGAPFDLKAAPNYQARINEAGLLWPPPRRIDYPAKIW